MRIFITGIAGFLGSHLADSFALDGHEVSGCDSLIGGDFANIGYQKRVTYTRTDCNDVTASMLADIDVVYHCAATAYEGLSVFSPKLITQNIVGASVSMISAAIQARVKRFVMCSSMARYGTNEVPFVESMRPNPQDPYGIGKLASEQMLQNLAKTHGMEYVIAVPHNIIGPRQKYDDPYRNVASIMINRLLQGKQPIIYGNGRQKRCFSYIGDVLPALAKLATAPVDREIINIGPDEEFVTINHLAATIAEIIGVELDPIYMPDRPCEVQLATCSADKARALLGYETRYTLRESLRSMINDIKQRGTKPFKYHLPVEIQSDLTPETWTKRLI